jgi:hypothetical protein
VEEAVKGSDAVISVLGPKGKPNVMTADSLNNRKYVGVIGKIRNSLYWVIISYILKLTVLFN